jgi:hypothetical protein
MNLDEAIEELLQKINATAFSYNKEERKIEKSQLFISIYAEQNQLLKIVEILEELGIKFEVEIDGDIMIK